MDELAWLSLCSADSKVSYRSRETGKGERVGHRHLVGALIPGELSGQLKQLSEQPTQGSRIRIDCCDEI
jgi:hypothetical protein